MGWRRGSDDGSRQPGDGDLPELPPEFVVPDDARELAAEAAAIRAELRADQPDGATTPVQPRTSLSGPLIGLALMLIAAIGSLVIVVLPYTPSRPVRVPLAAPTVADGVTGGLLPTMRLPDEDGRQVAIRDVRPAVLLLMPAGCDCDALAADVARVGTGARVAVELVGPDEPPARPTGIPQGRVLTLSDPGDALSAAITPQPGTEPTAVLVRADGIIIAVVRGLDTVDVIRADLARLPAG